MAKLTRRLHDYRLSGEFLAAFLFISARYTIWPVFLWLRNTPAVLSGAELPLWCISIPLFGLYAWFVMFLGNSYEQYPRMGTDALLGGALFAAAAQLQHSVITPLTPNGEPRGASWIVFLGAAALLYRNFIARSSKSNAPSNEPTWTDSLRAGGISTASQRMEAGEEAKGLEPK